MRGAEKYPLSGENSPVKEECVYKCEVTKVVEGENLDILVGTIPLNDEEIRLVHNAADMINESIAIPCTGCSYCTDGCPMHIAIPKYFSLYNADKQEIEDKGWTPQGEYYDRLTNNFGKASDCIECGQCEGVCPQHLPIINNLKEVAKHFGK